MVFANLLARHKHTAPSFDEDRPEEIERYFSDLADILDTHAVVADDECKAAAFKYMKHHRTEKLWRSSPTFAEAGSNFTTFKDDILRLYPNSSTNQTYTMQDLDLLIGERARVGVFSTNNVGDYFRQFLLITQYLISKNRMSAAEQSRNFIRGFRPELVHLIMQRLQLQFLTHEPEVPYDVDDIYNAANFAIGG